MFDFTKEYREGVIQATIVVTVIATLLFIISIPSSTEKFVMWADEAHQPNCVVGAYIMFAKERLNQELFVDKLQATYPTLTQSTVSFGAVKAIWDDMFPSNKLICELDPSKPDGGVTTNAVVLGKPYLWIGLWQKNTNSEAHACLVYFHPDSVSFRHFLYDPKRNYNYCVTTNYDFFFSHTIRLYQVK